jgi:hypothetical protein
MKGRDFQAIVFWTALQKHRKRSKNRQWDYIELKVFFTAKEITN